ncbi:hypothetical protein CRX72_17440 [Pantoea sp. BRM17]|nr:hypothetical protein CRX72_17440 [Pantoea sp. BRM17]
MLQELGCSLAEIGHAERRRHFREDAAQIAAKVAISLQHGLTPVLCIGESEQGTPVSLKMYFGYQQTLAWCREVASLADHPAIRSGRVGLFILPAYPAIPAVAEIFAGTPVRIGGQDVCQAERDRDR